MTAIDSFLTAYELQLDYWDAAASKAREMIETELSRSGLRAISTSRAKSVERLTVKLQQRNRTKNYRTQQAIASDIIDLAGVRVALYFPGQMDEVEKIIA